MLSVEPQEVLHVSVGKVVVNVVRVVRGSLVRRAGRHSLRARIVVVCSLHRTAQVLFEKNVVEALLCPEDWVVPPEAVGEEGGGAVPQDSLRALVRFRSFG